MGCALWLTAMEVTGSGGKNFRSKVRAKLAVVKAASALQGNMLSVPLGFNSSSSRLLVESPEEQPLPPVRRRSSKEHVPCDKERAVKKAYKAAAELIGAAPGDLTLTKQRERPATPAEEVPEEDPTASEEALLAKIRALELQIRNVNEKTRKVEREKVQKIAQLDRILFHATCGHDLMKDLARQARVDACSHAIDMMQQRISATTPALIRIINDDLLKKFHPNQLTTADHLLDKYGRRNNLYERELPDPRLSVPGAIF